MHTSFRGTVAEGDANEEKKRRDLCESGGPARFPGVPPRSLSSEAPGAEASLPGAAGLMSLFAPPASALVSHHESSQEEGDNVNHHTHASSSPVFSLCSEFPSRASSDNDNTRGLPPRRPLALREKTLSGASDDSSLVYYGSTPVTCPGASFPQKREGVHVSRQGAHAGTVSNVVTVERRKRDIQKQEDGSDGDVGPILKEPVWTETTALLAENYGDADSNIYNSLEDGISPQRDDPHPVLTESVSMPHLLQQNSSRRRRNRQLDSTNVIEENIGGISTAQWFEHLYQHPEEEAVKTEEIKAQHEDTSGRKGASPSSVESSDSILSKVAVWNLFGRLKCLTGRDFHVTIVGSVVYTLYNVVFCLALASAVNPQHRAGSILGPMTKLWTIGTIFAGPLLITSMRTCPALYPTIDLFLAPFIADMARIVDDTLYEQSQSVEVDERLTSDAAFLSTLSVLIGIGLLLTVLAILLSRKVKVANLGAFLPYAVLCGFFSSVAVTLWLLAISVDTGGLTVKTIILSRSWRTVRDSLVHHMPSVIIGVAMFILGPRSPLMVPGIAMLTVLAVYVVMLITRVSLADAREWKWFWTEKDLVYSSDVNVTALGLDRWGPPFPFGPIEGLFAKRVNYLAVRRGLPTATAMAVIYFLRVYLHAVAIRKSAKVLLDGEEGNSRTGVLERPLVAERATSGSSAFSVSFSENGDHHTDNERKQGNNRDGKWMEKMCPPETLWALLCYGLGFSLVAFVGGAAVVPSMAVGPSLFKLGAKGTAPQYGCAVLLCYFYFTNFAIVGYLPKMAFSSLLVVSSLEMLTTWFVRSFSKINEKIEWAVVPVIMVFSFVIGMLESVALGIGLSTLIFVASFYRSGVVKFRANGLMIRSNVERSHSDGTWLDQNGDLVQILVLQNYLFFGNASSCLQHIQSMFEDPSGVSPDLDFPLPPIPRFLVIDWRLVTGLDASAVDVITDIFSLCKNHKCKLFLTGLSSRLKDVLSCGGVKPTVESPDHVLRFFPDLETALGKAEDGILSGARKMEARDRRKSGGRRGLNNRGIYSDFRYALEQIDAQHCVDFASTLVELKHHVIPVEIKAGQCLFESHGGVVDDSKRGLFFIEHGLIRVERDPTYSLTRGTGVSLKRRMGSFLEHKRLEDAGRSIGNINARSPTAGKMDAMMKVMAGHNRHFGHAPTFRLARIGPGWVIGALESCTGLQVSGLHVAATPCRLHHLSEDKMRQIEVTNPALMLQLYKLLALTLARRHDVAVEQLSTLHSIMNSSPPTRPVSRQTLGAINRALMQF